MRPWIDPLALARAVDARGEPYVLLHSALGGGRSYLAHGVRQVVTGCDFAPLAEVLTTDAPRLTNAWFGTLGYGLRHALERYTPDVSTHGNDLWMARFRNITVFDHDARTLTHWSETGEALPDPQPVQSAHPRAALLGFDRPRAAFLADVEATRQAIAAGELYQCNLTRKAFGTCDPSVNRVDLFARLVAASPASYMALIRTGEVDVLCSSPERFLSLDAEGRAATQPIKGSAPRGATPEEDARLRDGLCASAKERAENLMIVDLMRNDLARGCEVGSVRVEELFRVDSYATIHHLSSRISGQRRADTSPLELVKGCFPPGSMTGAPKIAAVEHARACEPLPRGIYSGALGWFGGDGSAELAVVIRTLLLRGGEWEWQTGSGIVTDSDPEAEWRESLVKARGVCAMLGIELPEE